MPEEIKVKKGESFLVTMDDHCVLVKVEGKDQKFWLPQYLCEWIKDKCDQIDFENNLLPHQQ